MFSGIFNYDNPVWRFIGKFFDVLILNVLLTLFEHLDAEGGVGEHHVFLCG